MTEYDYSPAAWERYMETQDRIDRWRYKAHEAPSCNPFAPTTPHVEYLELQEQLDKEQRHRDEAKYRNRSDVGQGTKTRPGKKDRRYSYDQYSTREMDRKYRSDTEEEDYAAKSKPPRTRRHRDSVSAVSSRQHERSSSRQESHVSTPPSRDRREEKYRPSTYTRQRELSSSSREKDRSDSEYRSSSRASYTTPTTSRSQSRQSNVVSTGQGYVLVEKDAQRPRTSTSTRATTPTSSRSRAHSHATAPSPTKASSRQAPPIVTTSGNTRTRASSRPSPLDLPLVPPPMPVVTDYTGYPVGPNSSSTTRASASATSPGVYNYPQQQSTTPVSAPPMTRNASTPTPTSYAPTPTAAPKPARSKTTPGYSSQPEGRSSYDNSYSWQGHLPSSGGAVMSPTKGSTSLLKRMFTGLALGKSSGRSSPKYPSMPKEQPQIRDGGKRITRKRSSSF